jgi:hypothetical protein
VEKNRLVNYHEISSSIQLQGNFISHLTFLAFYGRRYISRIAYTKDSFSKCIETYEEQKSERNDEERKDLISKKKQPKIK